LLSVQICRHSPTSQQLTALQPSQPCFNDKSRADDTCPTLVSRPLPLTSSWLVVGAVHRAPARAQPAGLTARAGAAGFALVAWGSWRRGAGPGRGGKGHRAAKDLLRKRGMQVSAIATGTQAWMARQRWRDVLSALASRVQMGLGMRSSLRRPRGWRCSGSPAKPRSRCPAGGPGRAVAQAKDRSWLSPGRSRMGSPAAAAAAEPLRRWKLDKRCAHRADGVPSITGSRFRTSEMLGAGERIRTADRPLTRRIAESSEVHRLPDQPRCLISRFWPPWSTPPVHSRC
jgi:hypothetical protein